MCFQKNVTPEPVGKLRRAGLRTAVIYDDGNSRQEQFFPPFTMILLPANWKSGPDTMFEITNILIVSTTPHNHMRLERFFDSLPQTLGEQPKA